MKSISISKPVVAVTAHAAFGAKNLSHAAGRTVVTAVTAATFYLKRPLA
jgi:hypothetical protein